MDSSRILARHGLITPEPRKRPKSSFIRFEADLPNGLWQADSTHWQLADGSGVDILNCLDDHTRLLVDSDTFVTVKSADVVENHTLDPNRDDQPRGVRAGRPKMSTMS